MFLSPRRGGNVDVRDYLPHAYLAHGEDVIVAGNITPGSNTSELLVTNKTGHYKVGLGAEDAFVKELRDLGYSVDFKPDPNSLK